MFAHSAPARRALRVAVVLLFSIGGSVSSVAQTPQILHPSTPTEGQEFGFSLDFDGPLAVVGARSDDQDRALRTEAGAAYVFRYDGEAWAEEARLTVRDDDDFGAGNSRLGWAVAVQGDEIFVGASGDDEAALNAGAVYVFRHDGGAWTETQLLTASDAAPTTHFGRAVDIEGDLAVIGAPDDRETGPLSGAVYVFRYDGAAWVEEAKLTASDPVDQAQFGHAVDLDDGRILVGAFGAQFVGQAYVFSHDGAEWNEDAILAADEDDAHNLAQFGVSVSLDGDRALIGANLNNELGSGAGGAYVFQETDEGWELDQKLTASDGTGFYLFGSAVALDGDRALVGAENWGPVVNGTQEDAPGKAYLFTYDLDEARWIETETFRADEGAAGDHFGRSVAMNGNLILIGAPDRDAAEPGAGEVFSYGDPTAVPVEAAPRPGAFRLSAAFPNPFRDTARLRLTLDRPEHARVRLVDLLGRQLRVVYDGLMPAGASRMLEIDARALPDGVYLVRVETATHAETRRIVLSR